MAIVLDKHNEVKTHYLDFIDALKYKDDGLRCCFDVDMIVHEYSPTHIDDLKLVPLEDFKCKRTIVGTGGTNINLESSFGLCDDDFITMNFKVVELVQNRYKMKGLLIPSSDSYFEIVLALARHFGFVDGDNSFILDESELSEINLVPFKLKYEDNAFIVFDIEKEMETSEFDSIVDRMYNKNFTI